MTETNSLDEARKRRKKGEDAGTAVPKGPLICLGHANGLFVFLDAVGQERRMNARQLGSRADLSSLFLGDTTWLMQAFPKRIIRKEVIDGETVEKVDVAGFHTAQAEEYQMAECGRAGIFGARVVIRKPGIWADDDGAPIVHCGDVIYHEGAWSDAGLRQWNQVWATDEPAPRPDFVALGAAIAREMQETIRLLWDFRDPGGEIMVMGVIGAGYLGAAAKWHPNAFYTGGAGSGKSMLLALARAASPMHHYTNDTSKAGLEQAIDGRALPSFIDEASDRVDQTAAQSLMDMMLASSGPDGTKGHRGSPGGLVRTVNVLGSITMASVSPPAMKAQHLQRFAMIHLKRPEAGADHRPAMEAAIARAREIGTGLWARSLASWRRGHESLALFRLALGRMGCGAREMDQIGAILAGWWILTEDGVPNEAQAHAGVGAVEAFIRTADEVAEDDAPARVVAHLLTVMVQLDRSTERATIGELIGKILSPADAYADVNGPRRDLGRLGIKVVLKSDVMDNRGRAVPRLAEGHGLWLNPRADGLKKLFGGTPWQGEKWLTEITRLESAKIGKSLIRIGEVPLRNAVWLSMRDVIPDDLQEQNPMKSGL